MTPMGMPARSLNPAMAFFARVTMGFWPVMAFTSSTAASTIFGFATAAPRPMLSTIFLSRGTCMGFLKLNCLMSAGTISFV